MKGIWSIVGLGVFLLIIQNGCSYKTGNIIEGSRIEQTRFQESVDITVELGLIFIPVKIEGEEYKFLFDTGATASSVSTSIRDKFQLKAFKKGHIVDSDKNRTPVDYVKINELQIGNVSFSNVQAFEGDFENNPILGCLEIDGIIGANILKHCFWKIDQDKFKISFSDYYPEDSLKEFIEIPFRTDNQNNIFINIGIGKATVKNLLLDFGSNGSIALPDKIFSVLEKEEIFDKILLEIGEAQSGIIGKPVTINRKIAVADSVLFGETKIKDVVVKTGFTGSVGNKLLSNFIVMVDYNSEKIYFKKIGDSPISNKIFGFKIGISDTQGMFIQSVIKNSPANDMGLRPGMEVMKFGATENLRGTDFCDYVSMMNNPPSRLVIELKDGKMKKNVEINRFDLSPN